MEEFRLQLQGYEVMDFTDQYRCKDGSYKWIQWRGKIDLQDQLVIAIARDITRLKQLEKQVEESDRKYRSDLKTKLKKEGSELSEKIGQLKMTAEDGKSRKTDVADTEQLFRLIQSIPSPKAEPFKRWLAKIATERLDELQDPELTIDRALGQIHKQVFIIANE